MTSHFTDGLPRYPDTAEPEGSLRTPWPEYLLKGTSALFGCAAWLALGIGLHNHTVDRWAMDELEAGGRAATGFFLYLPFYFLTPVVAIAVAISLVRRGWTSGPLVAMVGTVLATSAWAMLWGDLWGARPDLPDYSRVAAYSSLVSGLALALAFASRSRILLTPPWWPWLHPRKAREQGWRFMWKKDES